MLQEFQLINFDVSGGLFSPPAKPVPAEWAEALWSTLAGVTSLRKLDLRMSNEWDDREESSRMDCPDMKIFQSMSKLTQLR